MAFFVTFFLGYLCLKYAGETPLEMKEVLLLIASLISVAVCFV
jgi:F0F1-type ATP synthase assembly protein I